MIPNMRTANAAHVFFMAVDIHKHNKWKEKVEQNLLDSFVATQPAHTHIVDPVMIMRQQKINSSKKRSILFYIARWRNIFRLWQK